MSLERVVADLVERVERRFYGKHRGLVVDNADPEHLGRLKLRVPSVLGTEVVTGWALPCAPYGGAAGQGLLCIPEVGAGVWVEFEEGDLEFPVWVGTFWSKPEGESELPKPNAADGSEEDAVQDPPTRKILKTRAGHTLQLEDAEGEEMVTVVAVVEDGKKRHVITMNGEGIKVTDGKNQHVVELAETGITITDGKNQHVVELAETGITITDGKNKHVVDLAETGITITDGKNKHVVDLTDAGVTLDDKVNSGTMSMAASGISIKNGSELLVGSDGIKVGGAAAKEHLVLGDQFKAMVDAFKIALDTHMHTGNLGAPTSPPVAPFVLDVPLSGKHTVEL